MKLKPKKNYTAIDVQRRIDQVAKSGGKYISEQELAELLGMSVKQAANKAIELKFARIPVKGGKSAYCYSKSQVRAYLAGETSRQ